MNNLFWKFIYNYFDFHFINYKKEGNRDKKAFHWRLFFRKPFFELECVSGFNFRMGIRKGYRNLNFTIGLFFCTLYLKVTCPKWFKLMQEDRETKFYFHEWAFVFYWHQDVNSAGGKYDFKWHQKWQHIYFHIDEFLLGKMERTKYEMLKDENVYFLFGGREYKMDSIIINRLKYFRTHIPFRMWHKTYLSYDLKIDHPPKYAGKGENSYDCGDDATYGSSGPYSGPEPTWQNRENVMAFVVGEYCQGVKKNIRRNGSASDGVSGATSYAYIGKKRPSGHESKSDLSMAGQILNDIQPGMN